MRVSFQVSRKSASVLWLLALSCALPAHAEDKGALRGMTYESLSTLPQWNGWWGLNQPVSLQMVRTPPPLKPEDLARLRTAAAQDSDPDPNRHCGPAQFTGSNGG